MKAPTFKNVYQFKIVLSNFEPKVERTIQVPENYSFWDLHVAIQDAMGWHDIHMHEFIVIDPVNNCEIHIGVPVENFPTDCKIMAGWKIPITKYFSPVHGVSSYTYDFGDDWQHSVRLERILERETNVKYPVCIDGKRACPPEDCGGTGGYDYLLEVLRNKSHEEYKNMKEWVGKKFDPDFFDPKKVKFTDPIKRLKILSESF